MGPIRIGIAGVGKIARDQHIPSIRANPSFEIKAACSREGRVPGVANFSSIEEMLATVADIDAVALCTPPQFHYEGAKLALLNGKHVLVEKPPCCSVMQVEHLQSLAARQGVAFYAPYHSQYADGVARAADLLRQRRLQSVRVTWKEDVRVWHRGQAWIWEAGGFGVFDPGINAISILTKLIHEPLLALAATLDVPRNCETPIAGVVRLGTPSGIEVDLDLDFIHPGVHRWDIDMETDAGPLKLAAGGGLLAVDGAPPPLAAGDLDDEYPAIYRRFADLVARRAIDVDPRPLRLVADIFLVAKRVSVDSFAERAE